MVESPAALPQNSSPYSIGLPMDINLFHILLPFAPCPLPFRAAQAARPIAF